MKKKFILISILSAFLSLFITGSLCHFFDSHGIASDRGEKQRSINISDPPSKSSLKHIDSETIPGGITKTEWRKINSFIERNQYQLHRNYSNDEYQTSNHAHEFNAKFSRESVEVSACNGKKVWHWGLSLKKYGYGTDLQAVPKVEKVVTQDNRIDYQRGDMVEWYINDHRGIEQGFTLKIRPFDRKDSAPLHLQMKTTGNLIPRVEKGGRGIIWKDTHGIEILRYSGLCAFDATGKVLASGMSIKNDEIRLFVNDHEAVYPITIDPFIATKKLLASDSSAGNYFGHSVSGSSIGGERIVIVGAYGDDDNGNASGSAFIFSQDQGGTDNWGHVTKLTASDGAAADYFGYSVSISLDIAIVGAYGDDDNGSTSGAAYIFYRDEGGVNNWGQVKKITASDGAANDQFGRSVMISGDILIVGAEGDDDNGSTSGAAYIFYRNEGGADNWGLVKKITASDGASDDHFGRSLSVQGETVIVGAYMDDDNGSGSGSAYIFERDEGGADNWGQVKKLTASDGAPSDGFGISVAISLDRAIVGADGDDDNGDGSGAAYTFDRDEGGADNWGQVQKLIAGDAAAGDRFGRSVSITGMYAIVGAYQDDDNGSSSGAAYVFSAGASEWRQVKKLTPSDGAAFDFFGYSVSIGSDTAIVGAFYDDDNGSASGSACIFLINEGGWDNWGQVKKITASDGEPLDAFGDSVSISGAYAIVGAFGDDDNGDDSGSANLFFRDQGGENHWGHIKKITPFDGETWGEFGQSVSISGETAIVGAHEFDSGSGAAYIFSRDQGGTDNWGQVKKLTASDGASFDFFGQSVAISEDTAIVGASGDNYSHGAAYIFSRDQGGTDNWGQVKKLTASDGAYSDLFGVSVSISIDTAIIGAHADDDNGSASGAAYIFSRDQGGADNWGEVKKLTASDGTTEDYFGISASISGDTAIVGAIGNDDGRGAAYTFSRDQGGSENWGQIKKLTASDGAEDDEFGQSVSISGDIAIVGVHYDDTDNGVDTGSAYIFSRNQGGVNNWGEVQNLTAPDGAADDHFARSVSISEGTAIVGVPLDDDNGVNSGSAYIFSSHHCEMDFEPDGDVDGIDLVQEIFAGGSNIKLLAEDFGRADCP